MDMASTISSALQVSNRVQTSQVPFTLLDPFNLVKSNTYGFGGGCGTQPPSSHAKRSFVKGKHTFPHYTYHAKTTPTFDNYGWSLESLNELKQYFPLLLQDQLSQVCL